MGDTRFQAIEALAYQLWLDAGRPDGCALNHWYEAEERISQAEAATGAGLSVHVNEVLRGRTAPQSPVPTRSSRRKAVKAVA